MSMLCNALKKPSRRLVAAALAAAFSAPASALVLLGAQSSGATVATDYSGTGSLSFDIDFADASPVSLQYRLEAGDLLSPLGFDAVVRNYTGAGFDYLSFVLDGVVFASVGSVTRAFGSSQAEVGGTSAELIFTPPEFLDVEIGDALGGAGKVDWTLSLAGRSVGDVISVQVAPAAVPEPSMPVLVAMALGLAAVASKRRR